MATGLQKDYESNMRVYATSVTLGTVSHVFSGKYNKTCSDTTSPWYQYIWAAKNSQSTAAYAEKYISTVTVTSGSTAYYSLSGDSGSSCTIRSFTYYTGSVTANVGGSVKSGSTTIASSGQTVSKTFTDTTSVSLTATATNSSYMFNGWSNGSTSATITYNLTDGFSITAYFIKKPYLTVKAGSNGSITTDPSGYVTPNTTARAVATPDDGYRFVRWTGSDGTILETATADLPVGTSNVTYTATFASKYHKVTVGLDDASTDYGTVKMSYADGTEIESGTSIIEDTEIVFTCTPKVDYNFAYWKKSGVAYAYSTSYSYTISDSDGDVEFLAYLTEKNSYNISVTKVDPSRGTVALSDKEKSWSETNNAISATGHSGVKYTVTAKITSSLSATGRELNKFSGFTKNGSNLSSTASEDGLTYTATFTNGNNISGESLDDIAIVATFAQKTLYHAELSIPYESRGTAIISPDQDSTSPNDRWLEGTITAVATPATGMYVRSFNVQDLDAGTHGFVVDYPDKDSSGNYNCSFTLNFNAKIIVNFDQIPCTVSVGIDSASYGKGTATVSSTAQGGDVSNMAYGDIAIYAATPNDGYQFGGWYLTDGSVAPESTVTSGGVSTTYKYTDAEYRISLTGDLKLIAKFKAKVTLGLSSTASAGGTVYLDDESTSSGTVEKWVTLGDSCTIKAVPSSSTSATSYFGSWYKSTDTEFTDPLDLASEETITVTDTTYYVARFISSADALYCAMCNFDNDTDAGDASLGNLFMMTGGSSSVEVDETTWTDFSSATGISEVPDGVTKFYKLVGTARVTLVASTASGRGFNKWMRLTVNSGSIESEVSLGMTASLSTVVNRHFIYRAYWGDPKPSLITMHYCTGNNITNGNINIDGVSVADSSIEDKEQTDTETSATYTQGDVVKISVDIKNGYLFDGWYYDEEHNEPLRDSTVDDVTYTYADGEYRFVVSSPVTIFAKFKRDTNALYKWEGSDEKKMMDWKSKVYVSSRPFDPTVVRVDADGYTTDDSGSLSLTIGMFSSPNSAATSTRTLNISNQDMRRIPVRRPERYAQVEVKNNDDVNAIFVGTSSQGIVM